MMDFPLGGKKLGDATDPYFASIPFANSDYYLDDFSITAGTFTEVEDWNLY